MLGRRFRAGLYAAMMLAVVGMLMFGTTTLRGASAGLVGIIYGAARLGFMRDQRPTARLIESATALILGVGVATQGVAVLSGVKGRAMWPVTVLGIALGVGVAWWGGRGLWRAWRRRKVRNRVA